MDTGLADYELAECLSDPPVQVPGTDAPIIDPLTGNVYSHELSYRSRYNKIPKCALNYDDASCDSNVIPILPHSNLSAFGEEYVRFMCSQGKCPPGSTDYRKELWTTDKKTMEHPTLYKDPETAPRPYSIFDSFLGLKEGFSGQVEGMSGIMGCDIYGSSFIAIMGLLLALLAYRIYFAKSS